MNEWECVLLLWPRKVEGRWRWLSRVERRYFACGCSLYGDYQAEYRAIPEAA
jgi:hypothetical protein